MNFRPASFYSTQFSLLGRTAVGRQKPSFKKKKKKSPKGQQAWRHAARDPDGLERRWQRFGVLLAKGLRTGCRQIPRFGSGTRGRVTVCGGFPSFLERISSGGICSLRLQCEPRRWPAGVVAPSRRHNVLASVTIPATSLSLFQSREA